MKTALISSNASTVAATTSQSVSTATNDKKGISSAPSSIQTASSQPKAQEFKDPYVNVYKNVALYVNKFFDFVEKLFSKIFSLFNWK